MTNCEIIEIAMRQSAEDIGCPQISERADYLQFRFLWK